MDKLINFKTFVRKNPILLKYVKNGEMSWQKFYEIYDMYEEDESAWKSYITSENIVPEVAATSFGFADIIGLLKNADLSKIEEGINSVQRVIGVVQDLGTKDTPSIKPTYKARPLYKHFED